MLVPGLILAAVAALLVYAAQDVFRPAVAVQVSPVVAKEASGTTQSGGVVTQAPGWVEPDPFAIGVPALADGVVEQVLVLEGQAVQAGQALVRLVADDARLALARAEASLADAQVELAAAELLAGTTSTTQPSAAGPIALAEVRRELDRLPVQIAAARARLAELAADSQAKTKAAERGVVSAVAAAVAEARARAQQAEVDALALQEPVLRAQLDRLAVETEQALGKARAAVQSAQAARDEAALRLLRMDIRAPVAGTVLSRNVAPGAAVMAISSGGMPPIRLYSPDKLQVRVDVPLAHAAKVHVGLAAELTVDVLPDRVFVGEVTRVVHEADIQRNTLQFKVAIRDPSPELKPEMLSRVKFIASPTKSASPGGTLRLFAPSAAAPGEPGQSVTVMVADPARKLAVLRKVTLGTRAGDYTEIVDGLQPGDRLIVSPLGLKDGQRIRIVDADDSRSKNKGERHAAD